MESNKCEVCGAELPVGRRKICSHRCSDRKDYLKNREKETREGREKYKERRLDPNFREYHRQKSREWYQKNKQRQNKNLLRDYRKNKDRWESRRLTRELSKQRIIDIEEKCKSCGIENNLQIHHEEYATTRKEIIRLVLQQKIYKLCKGCHKLLSPSSKGKGI